jgi:L-lactate utilization protein LutC
MEKEKLVAQAEGAGVVVHWTTPAGLKGDLEAFLAGRTFVGGAGLDLRPSPTAAPAEADVGVARARVWVEETATALVEGEDAASLLPPVSVLLVRSADVVEKYDSLVDALKAEPSRWFAAVTGPSRTADIEKVLVIPAHGPRELHLFIIC